MHYILVETATGKRLNDSADMATFEREEDGKTVSTVKDDEEIIAVEKWELQGVWVAGDTKAFVPRPITNDVRCEAIINRFTPAEYKLLVASEDVDARVFASKLSVFASRNFLDQSVIDEVNALVPAGVLTTRRAEDILSGV